MTAPAAPPDTTPLRTLCGWCGVLIRDGRLTPDGNSSHGCCPSCLATLLAEAGLRRSA